MLTFIATDINENTIELKAPLYVTINMEEDVPADDLTVTFPFISDLEELDKIQVFSDSSVVFTGIVDEQQSIITDSNMYTKIIARSMAALLLDNECKPVNYINPSTSVIYNRHLKPFNIERFKGDEVVLPGSFNLAKGSTNWQAFYNFSINAFGKVPGIEPDATANFNGLESDRKVIFSNYDADKGIKYCSLKENNKRYALISSVYAKVSQLDDYTTEIINESLSGRNINRVRYIDATSSTQLTVADKMIANSNDASYEITVDCCGAYLDILGAKATLHDKFTGTVEDLYVSALCYNLNSTGEITTAILKRRDT